MYSNQAPRMDEQAPLPRFARGPQPVMNPGLPPHPRMPVHPRHPRHPGHPRQPPGASYRSDVTQDVGPGHSVTSRILVPPHPPIPNRPPIRQWDLPAPDGEEARAISRPTSDPQWPLTTMPSAPYPRDPDPHQPPGHPSMGPSRLPHPKRAPFTTDYARPIVPSLHQAPHHRVWGPKYRRRQPQVPDHQAPTSHGPGYQEPEYLASYYQDPEYQGPDEQGPADQGHQINSQDIKQLSGPNHPVHQHPEETPPGASTPQNHAIEIPALPAQARKPAGLGPPPPSSRRGQPFLFEAQALISTIREESLRSRSRGSYASSAAMPDSLYVNSTNMETSQEETRYGSSLYEDEREKSTTESKDDERGLTHSTPHQEGAPTAMSADPSLPDAARPGEDASLSRHADPFNEGSLYTDVSAASSPSNTFSPRNKALEASPDTAHTSEPATIAMPDAESFMTTPNPAEWCKASGSPQPVSRLQAKRRPLKLDIDAVRAAEARGSMTSLPDLIRRATRLASMIEKGKRPTSRIDDLDMFEEKSSAGPENRSFGPDQHASGLSNMLAAFPPPIHTPQNGVHKDASHWAGSWPMIPGIREQESIASDVKGGRRPRRCCGLPPWAFVLVIVLILCVIAVAITLPLEFLVFKNLGNHHQSNVNLSDCRKSLTCLHGGTNAVFQNTCSCICTNGYTGSSCNIKGADGCMTSNLIATDGSSRINNVTLGRAIPRVIAASTGNFSIPLAATSILAKFNSANLSCTAQNSLMTFDGQYTRIGAASAPIQGGRNTVDAVIKAATAPTQSSSGSSSSPIQPPAPSATFVVTEEVLDFARTVVLYVLQEESVDSASTAQGQLQQFFNRAGTGQASGQGGVTIGEAWKLNIGGNGTVDLVSGAVDIGQGPIGGEKSFG